MIKYIIAGLLFGAAHGMTVPALANKNPNLSQSTLSNDYGLKGLKAKSRAATGCMLLRECTDGVKEVNNLLDISSEYPNTGDFTNHAYEFNHMIDSLKLIGVKVFLADDKYFPIGHRGVYHTVSNNFFLNKLHMSKPWTLIAVMRHEGWHAAQDCMASLDNEFTAIIHAEESVPEVWRMITEKTYPEHAVPWEAEAMWAGKTQGMTMKALESCAAGTMWTDYEMTPLTKEWLVDQGYITE